MTYQGYGLATAEPGPVANWWRRAFGDGDPALIGRVSAEDLAIRAALIKPTRAL